MIKNIAIILCILFLFKYLFVLSQNSLNTQNLYYLDTDNNWKIDTFELVFNNELTWSLDFEKIKIYSDTWGLSTSKLEANNIFSWYTLSWNTIILNIIEQNNFLTWLTVNNSTSSHLRFKTYVWNWIKDIYWSGIEIFYWNSFDSYKNVFFKENLSSSWKTFSWEIIETWSLILTWSWILTWTWENLTNSWETSTWNTSSWEVIQDFIIPETKIEFQSPSYLIEKDSENILNYNCDQSKTDCKVNFNILMNNSWSFSNISTSKYNCEWNFWIDEFFEEKYKCNPTTIIYPVWNFDVSYTITHISSWKKITKNFKINNLWYKEELNTKIVYSTSTQTQTIIYIDEPKIEIQSWLDEQNNCKNFDCSINLIYNTKNSKEACLWDFWNWIYDAEYKNKCNPWYIKYWEWEFMVKLKVYEILNESNYKESFLKITNFSKNQEINEVQKEEIKNENVLENEEKETKKDNEDIINRINNYKKWLIISSYITNPFWKDDFEFIELKNISQNDINLINCKLDDKIKWWSKSYEIDNNLFLKSWETKKFYKYETNISLDNTKNDEINLICDNELIYNVITQILPEWKWFDIEKKDFYEFNKLDNLKNIIKYENTSSWKQVIKINEDDKITKLIEDNFDQKIKILKSWVKIYGKTFPNIQIIIKFDNFKKYYVWKSDDKWNYEIIIKDTQLWNYKINNFLKIYEDIYINTLLTNEFEIDNEDIEYMSYQTKEKSPNKKLIQPLKSNITLQKLAKNIQVSWKIITCKDTDKCKINFDWRNSSWDLKEISWTIDDKEVSNKINPSSFDFATWTHLINLKISDLLDEDNSTFIVKVEWKIKKYKQAKKTVEKEKKEEIKKNTSWDFSIIPQANASYLKSSEKDLFFHLIMSSVLFFIFLFFSFILLRRKNIL